MIVVDSGAYLEPLLSADADHLVHGMLEEERSFAPELFDAEVLHRIVRAQKHGRIEHATAQELITDLELAPIDRISHRNLVRLALPFTDALSGYDALYVALAHSLSCTLVTTDGRLAATATEQFGLAVMRIPTSGRSGA